MLIGDDHSGRIKLPSLRCQLLHTVVCCETIDLVAIGMLRDDIKCLCAYAARRAEYTDRLLARLLIIVKSYVFCHFYL